MKIHLNSYTNRYCLLYTDVFDMNSYIPVRRAFYSFPKKHNTLAAEDKYQTVSIDCPQTGHLAPMLSSTTLSRGAPRTKQLLVSVEIKIYFFQQPLLFTDELHPSPHTTVNNSSITRPRTTANHDIHHRPRMATTAEDMNGATTIKYELFRIPGPIPDEKYILRIRYTPTLNGGINNNPNS